MPTNPAIVSCVLAIMEVEPWFLIERNHFRRIDPTVTLKLIQTRIALDLPTTGV